MEKILLIIVILVPPICSRVLDLILLYLYARRAHEKLTVEGTGQRGHTNNTGNPFQPITSLPSIYSLMTQDDLQKHPLYEQCSRTERVFISVYLSTGGSIVQAVNAAFPNVRRILTKGRQLQDSRVVGTLMAIIDGEQEISSASLEQIAYDAIRRASKPYEVYKGIETIRKLRALNPKEDHRTNKVRRGKEIDEDFRRKNNG